MAGLAKVTLMPAQRLESVAPQMKRKGRIQLGADADFFFTSALTGCTVQVFGPPYGPTVTHTNAGGIDCDYYREVAAATRGHANELLFVASFFCANS